MGEEDFKAAVDRMLEDFEQQESLNSCAWHIPLPNIQENVPAKNNTHMLAERQRRKRENELLRSLKNLIPYPVKRDKLSILQGAVSYVRQLQADSEEDKCQSPMKSQELESRSRRKEKPIRVGVEAGKLLPALSRLRELGFQVSSLELGQEGLRAEIGVHSMVDGSPSSSELQQILDNDC